MKTVVLPRAGSPISQGGCARRAATAYTLVEILVAAAIAALLVLVLFHAFGWGARSGVEASAQAGASLELTELLEYLSQDLREADDLLFEERQGVTTLTLARGPLPGETGGTTRTYEVADGGRKVMRSDGTKRRRRYDLGQAGGEEDRLLIELTSDRRTLSLRALGLTLSLPTPFGRETTVDPAAVPAAGIGGGARPRFAAGAGLPGTATVDGEMVSSGTSDALDSHEDSSISSLDQPPVAASGSGLAMEGDAHVPAVTYRFAGGGDEGAVMGTDPDSANFGLFESRSNLRDPASGQPIIFFRGSKPGREPAEPIYILPDPFRGRTISGGTPDEGWSGIDTGPGLSGWAPRVSGVGGSGKPAEPDRQSSASDPGTPARAAPPADGSAKTGNPVTLDSAVAAAIGGDTAARNAILDTIRELRGLPPGTTDQVLGDVQANLDRARQELAAQVAAGAGPSSDGSFGPLERATSINRQIIRNEIVKEQRLNPATEADAADAVAARRANPGFAAPEPAGPGTAPEPPPPQQPPADPPPAPVEHDGR